MQTFIPVTPITCKNCGNRFTGKYCNECGEKVYTEHDRTAVHFAEEGFHFLTHFDGKLFTTIKTLFTKPGQVSLDYTNGVRKKYFKLLSLFMLLVVLYLLFPLFPGLNMRLYNHTHHQLYGTYAMKKAQAVMLEHHLNDAQITEAFHKISEKVSKFLLIILIPMTALYLWAVSFKKRPLFFDQMVFATEVNCVYIIWGFLVLPLLVMGGALLYRLITGNHFFMEDDVTFLLLSIPFAIFIYIASRRYYNLGIVQALLFALCFIVAHTFIVHYLYKFILFVVVINQIH
jgi:hypothetical protein